MTSRHPDRLPELFLENDSVNWVRTTVGDVRERYS